MAKLANQSKFKVKGVEFTYFTPSVKGSGGFAVATVGHIKIRVSKDDLWKYAVWTEQKKKDKQRHTGKNFRTMKLACEGAVLYMKENYYD